MLALDSVTAGKALRSVSLVIGDGEMVAVRGSRRSGRTTLLRIAMGLERPDSGQVHSEGRVVLVRRSWTPLGGETVLDQLALPLLARMSVARSRIVALRMLVDHGVGDWMSLRPADLEDGELVRLSILRALICSPDVLLVDDPTAVVDRAEANAIIKLLRYARDQGVAGLITTGDAGLWMAADRMYALDNGVLLEAAQSPAQVIDFPRRGTG